jgi:4-hydroxy-2-oxoheptanedioate aldolase
LSIEETSVLRENRIKRIWRGGGAALNGWLHIPSSYAAELMAHAGYDRLTVDLQHGASDFNDALSMMQAISTTDAVPLVRVPWNEPGLIMKVLDAGSYGVICPMINTRADAERFVGACRYPPEGYRSFGPFRASLYGGADYAAHANEAVITMAMIETHEALQNLDEIVSVPGLDAVFVGPADLGRSLGEGPGLDRTEPAVVEAIDEVLGAVQGRGIVAGIFTGSTEYAARMVERGFRFVTVLSDGRLLAAAGQTILALKGEGGAMRSVY